MSRWIDDDGHLRGDADSLEEFIRVHVNGACDAFAVAHNRIYGLPIRCVWIESEDYDPDFECDHDEVPMDLAHAFILLPGGQAIDAAGRHVASELEDRYRDGRSADCCNLTETELRSGLGGLPGEDAVEEAAAVIRALPRRWAP